jgi:hypothetical protein
MPTCRWPRPWRAQILHDRRAHRLLAPLARGVDDGAHLGQVGAAQEVLDRTDGGRAHRQRPDPDGGKAQRFDRAAGILAAED